MKSLIYSLLLFSVLVFGSCNRKQEVQVVDTFTFNTGIVDVFFRYVGFYDKNGQDCVYFIDKERFIKIFGLSGKLQDSISLNNLYYELAQKNDKIHGGVKFMGKDSILLDSYYRNKLALIDRKGKVLNIFEIDSFLPKNKQNQNSYTFALLPNANEIKDVDFFSVRYNGVVSEEKFRVGTLDYYQDYFNTLYEIPCLLKIEKTTDSVPNIEFLAKKYYQSIKNEPFVGFFDNGEFKIINGKIFIISNKNNSIVQLSGKNFQNEKYIKIKSEYIDHKVFAPTVKEVYGDIQSTQKLYKKYEDTENLRGAVCNIFYNSKNRKYYVVAGHNLKNNEEFEKYSYDLRPFSVILYDENFENPTEYTFTADIYKFRNAIMTSKGLLIERKQENININNYGTQTFDLLDFR